ncbi:MAG: hypothetical protein FWJ90_11835 [Actinomadura sp.]
MTAGAPLAFGILPGPHTAPAGPAWSAELPPLTAACAAVLAVLGTPIQRFEGPRRPARDANHTANAVAGPYISRRVP